MIVLGTIHDTCTTNIHLALYKYKDIHKMYGVKKKQNRNIYVIICVQI